MKRKSKTAAPRVLIGFVGLAVVLALAWWWTAKSHEQPPRTADIIQVLPHQSSFAIPVSAKLSDIESKLNSSIPATLYSIDEGLSDCVPPQWIDKCIVPNIFTGGCSQHLKTIITPGIDCHLSGAVTRRGSVSVAGAGQNIALKVPINVSVTAKGRGEIGKNIQSTASGDFDATATLTFDIDEDWKPSGAVSADYNWTDPPHVWILGFKITFADKVDPEIRKQLDSLRQKLPQLLSDLNLRALAAQNWEKAFTVIQVSKSPSIWITVAPESVGYSGYSVSDGKIQLTLSAAGNVSTSLGSQPAPPSTTSLPKLARTQSGSGFDFSLPLYASYSALEDQLKLALKVGEQQSFTVRGVGDVKVTFKDVVLHQTTGKALALGLSLEADPPSSFLSTKGTIWLTTKFELDNDKKVVAPETLAIYSNTNNVPADLLVSLVQLPPINDILRNALRYDFSSEYARMLKEVNGSLRRQLTPDMYIDGRVDTMRFEDIAAGPDGLAATLKAHGMLALYSGRLQ